MSKEFYPETAHALGLVTTPRALAYTKGEDLRAWQKKLRRKLKDLMGTMPDKVPLRIRRIFDRKRPGFREIRFEFQSEKGARVPCHLLLPLHQGPKPVPVVICLQGHSSGMHVSIGRKKVAWDQRLLDGQEDFGVQAVKQGYAALVMEQRCFGERGDHQAGAKQGCRHASMVSLLLGRSMIGERVWDVRRAIDALETFPEIDATRVACLGNSGGGTITWFAACVEPRIKVVMPSCSVCSLPYSIGSIAHCPDNYLPGFLRWFDMQDLAGLIAPRPLIVVTGAKDDIFPLKGVRLAYHRIQTIYAAAGAKNKSRLLIGRGGHRFYPALAWPVFNKLSGWG
ncbi:MAG: alpha/beta hydrolase family protein [candidate division FCPU426 bacterium]